MKKIPQLHHHRASGRARVYYRGKHYYLGKWGSPESAVNYQNFLRQVANLKTPIVKGGGLPVWVCVDKFLCFANEYYPNGQQAVNLKSTLRVFREQFEWVPITEIGPLKIIEMMERLAETESRYRINRILAHVKRLMSWLVSREWISAEKLNAIKSIKSLEYGRTKAIEYEPITAVPAEIVEKTCQKIYKTVKDMINIQLLTAMRPNEVCNLTFAQLDRSKKVWIYTPKKHKTQYRGHVRKILIGPEAQAILLPYSFTDQSEKVFRNQKNVPYTSKSYAAEIFRHNISQKIEHWTPNQLRHSAATRLVNEFGWEAARVILGHKSFNITQIYAEENLAKTAEIIGKIG